MNDNELRLLQDVLSESGRKPSALFDHLSLIKFVWEAGFGTPTIVKALKRAGVSDGISLPNVQGFIKRAQRDGRLGAKGSNSKNRLCVLDQLRKLDSKTDNGSSAAVYPPVARLPESPQPVTLSPNAPPKTAERPLPSKSAVSLRAKVEASRKKK